MDRVTLSGVQALQHARAGLVRKLRTLCCCMISLCFLMYCQDRRAVDRTFQKARTQPPSQPSPSVPSAAHLGEVGLLGVGEHPACLHIPDVRIADQVRHLQDRRLLSGVFVRKTLWPSKLQTSRSAPGSGSQMLDQQLEDGVFSCLWRIQT